MTVWTGRDELRKYWDVNGANYPQIMDTNMLNNITSTECYYKFMQQLVSTVVQSKEGNQHETRKFYEK